MTIIEPVKTRKPFFDGWETDQVCYVHACHRCAAKAKIGFREIHAAAWGWRENTEEQLRSSLASHFGIDLSSKYIGNGMDAVVLSQCQKCSDTNFIYFWFHEYRHSCFEISLRGSAASHT